MTGGLVYVFLLVEATFKQNVFFFPALLSSQKQLHTIQETESFQYSKGTESFYHCALQSTKQIVDCKDIQSR